MLSVNAPLRAPEEPSSREVINKAPRASWQEMLNDSALDPESRVYAASRIAQHVAGLVTRGGLECHYPGIWKQTCAILASPTTSLDLRLPLSRLLLDCIRIHNEVPQGGGDPFEGPAHEVCLMSARYLLRHARELSDRNSKEREVYAHRLEDALEPYAGHLTAQSKALIELFDAEAPPLVQAVVLNALSHHLVSSPYAEIDESDRTRLVTASRLLTAETLRGVLTPRAASESMAMTIWHVMGVHEVYAAVLASSITAGVLLGDSGVLEFIDLLQAHRLTGYVFSVRRRVLEAKKGKFVHQLPGVEELAPRALERLGTSFS